MQSRTTILLTTLLIGTACARQIPNDMTNNYDDTMSEGGSGGTAGGTTTKAGSGTVLGSSGTTTMSSAGKNTGGGTALPPAGSGGKTGSGGKSSGGSGGSGGASGGTDTGMSGSGGMAPVNMPVVGISVTYKAESSTDPNDFIGGEVDLINDTAQPFTLSDLKIRYYFSNEITGAVPTVMVNWAQFGPQNNLGGATCTGTIAPVPTPAAGADDYVELTCTGQNSTDLSAGTMLKASWKAGAQGQGKFIVTDDYSFSDPSKIVVLNGNTIIWGVAP